MESNRVIAGTIGLFVVICLVGAVLAPMINDWATGERITNEGAGWLRMAYTDVDSSTDYAFEVDMGADIIVYDTTSGSQDPPSQTGQDDTIVYASSNMAVWTDSGTIMILGTDADDNPYYYTASSTLVLSKTLQGLNIYIDGSNDGIALPNPTWAYVPKSNGTYGFFDNGTSVQTEEGKPIAAVGGGFAGVYAYNNIARYAGLGLQLQTTQDTDGLLNGAYWAKPAAQQDQRTLDPITLDPLDPGLIRVDLDPEPDAGVRSVPTPTYTDGDWGYDTEVIDGVTKAIIVSYSGTGGNVTVPSTVGGYSVYRFGKTAPEVSGANQVFDNATISANSTLTFSDGLVQIGSGALHSVSNMTGSLIIPDSVTAIGGAAFYKSGFDGDFKLPNSLNIIRSQTFNSIKCTGMLIIPDSVTEIGDYAFQTCTGFSGLKLSNSLTTLGSSVFSTCSSMTGTLTLPLSLTDISSYTFSGCHFETIVIPNTIESIGAQSFAGCSSLVNLIISSEATPLGSGSYVAFRLCSNVQEMLDLSDTVDYSVNRYGFSNDATVQDNIGDALGYISFTEIGSDPLVPAGAAAVMLAIPVVILGALIVVAATTFIRKE